MPSARPCRAARQADIFVNTWPAFRKELADAGMLRDLGPLWDSAKIGDNLSDTWKDLGSTDGKLYGVTYTFGDRSAMFYKTATMKKAGIETQPKTWDEFVANFDKLNEGRCDADRRRRQGVVAHRVVRDDLRAPERRRDGRRAGRAQDSVDRSRR